MSRRKPRAESPGVSAGDADATCLADARKGIVSQSNEQGSNRDMAVSGSATGVAGNEADATAVASKKLPAKEVSPVELAAWVTVLTLSQIVMYLTGKAATRLAQAPLFLCLAQFSMSSLCASVAVRVVGKDSGARESKAEQDASLQRLLLLGLGVSWSLGFALLNASLTILSAAMANTIRGLEPLTTVVLGFCVVGERYSLRVLMTLLPISLGVAMAASRGSSHLSVAGVTLAFLSNFAFSTRPFLAKRLAKMSSYPGELVVFLHAMLIGTGTITVPAVALEGGRTMLTMTLLSSESLRTLGLCVLTSAVSFFIYQLSQMMLMSKLSAVAFSVVSPLSKVMVIASCAVISGDDFGAVNIAGMGIATGGVVSFSIAMRRERILSSKES